MSIQGNLNSYEVEITEYHNDTIAAQTKYEAAKKAKESHPNARDIFIDNDHVQEWCEDCGEALFDNDDYTSCEDIGIALCDMCMKKKEC